MSAIRDLPPITDWRRPWRQPAFWGVLAALCLIAGGAVFVLDVIGSAADVPAEYLWLALAVFAALGVTALGISALAAQRRLALVSGSLEAENDLLVRSLEAEPHARLIAGPEGEAVYANSAFSALFAIGPHRFRAKGSVLKEPGWTSVHSAKPEGKKRSKATDDSADDWRSECVASCFEGTERLRFASFQIRTRGPATPW